MALSVRMSFRPSSQSWMLQPLKVTALQTSKVAADQEQS